MREIKFRVWEKPGVALSNTDGTQQFSGKMHTEYDWKFWGYALSRPEEYELLRWTYLHDQKGNEIYEGDIVKQRGMHFEVYWDIPIAGFFRKTGGRIKLTEPLWAEEGEVIGNIYEHPHLLEADT